jgi:hypothetical protein
VGRDSSERPARRERSEIRAPQFVPRGDVDEFNR